MFSDDDIDFNNHPLAKGFGMVPDDGLSELTAELVIPEDKEARDLHLMIDFALKGYKAIMDDLALIEPKNRIKNLEVAERYLGQAKDARYKLDMLELNRKKLTQQKSSGAKGAKTEEKPEGGMVSRADLYSIAGGKKG